MKLVKALSIIAIGVFLFLYFYRYQTLQQRYPNPVNETVGIGEAIEDGSFTVTLQKSTLIEGNELKKLAPNIVIARHADGTPYEGKSIRILLADIRVKKTQECEDTYNFTKILCESGAWSNGLDGELFMQLNKGISMVHEDVPYNHYVDVILPFSMVETMFKDSDWKSVDSRSFGLIYSLYPMKKSMITSP